MKAVQRAVYLIDDNEHPFSGWTFDNRGLELSQRGANTRFNFEKVYPQYESVLKRKFKKQTDGLLTLEANFAIDAPDGFSLKLYDDNMMAVLGIITKNSEFCLLNGKKSGISHKSAGNPDENINCLKAVIDLNEKTYSLALNNNFIGNFNLPNNISNLQYISIGIDKGYTGKLFARGIKLYKDYSCNERFLALYQGITPIDWKVDASDAELGTIKAPNNTFSLEDIYYYGFNVQEDGKGILSKEIKELQGNRCFEIKFIQQSECLNGYFILNGSENGIAVNVRNGNLYLNNIKVCDYPINIWNTLRLEISNDDITLRLNGKDKGVISTDIPCSTTEIVIKVMPESETNIMGIDDILLFGLDPLPTDYVKEPVPAKTKGYNIGVHVCSLWRYGFWRGTHDSTWDVCTPFDELTPKLGYYDEGIPEVNDWETKWFCENGIDFQLQCWYGPKKITEPIKFPGFSFSLHDGFFNSQYKKYSKFALMWENNFTESITPEAFKEYFVPYMIEYYFKDPSYYCIDNKPVFSVYCIRHFTTDRYFGSVEKARECIDYMRQKCKEAGFDGMIFWCAEGSAGESAIKQRTALGVDGSYAYNWGPPSFTAENQIDAITNTSADYAKYSDKCVHIPTLGVGFNAVARHDRRTPSISMDEYEKLITWARDEYLTNKDYYIKDNTWQSKTLLLSCWNEFDEGHYINPSGLHGYGFLEKLRKVFTEEAPTTYTDPTDNQKSRICNMFPKGHSWLRPERRLSLPKIEINESKVVKSWDFDNENDYDSWFLSGDAEGKEHIDGCLYGYATGVDPQVIYNGIADVPVNDIDIIHIQMKTHRPNGELVKDARIMMYYSTSASPRLSDGQTFRLSGNYNQETGYTDYYVGTEGANGWSGNLQILRIDPILNWSIKKIELLYAGINFNMFVNGNHIYYGLPIEQDNGYELVAMFYKSNLMNNLNATYKWNRSTKEFSLLIDDYEFCFVCGSDIMRLGEKSIKLPTPARLIDGVPAIPLKVICDILGYNYSYEPDKKQLNITTK